MTELWESVFADKQMMWGPEPSRSAVFARDYFARSGAKEILVPGLGYGRNAKPFLEHGMSVTGIEISGTAIGLARTQMGLDIPIHHGSVADMPYDTRLYDGVFSYGLLYLLAPPARAKLLQDCHRQLRKGGAMIFTVISKQAPMFGRGSKLGDDWYEVHPGVQMFFYDAESIRRELGPHGEIELSEIDEATPGGGTFPFINVVCRTE
ncbi:class I SAM-dependent methyltransferase [Sorangium sp. So ce1014]|uniref:class I SAM-dependent methyltransferase n=1 Tax=Sorangium sp. So ce1014 TaxID=3133326 RepID=UPI003F6249BE